MATYDVTQIICRERIVRVEAANQDAAIDRAKAGYGRIVTNQRGGKLLCSEARRVTRDEVAAMREP